MTWFTRFFLPVAIFCAMFSSFSYAADAPALPPLPPLPGEASPASLTAPVAAATATAPAPKAPANTAPAAANFPELKLPDAATPAGLPSLREPAPKEITPPAAPTALLAPIEVKPVDTKIKDAKSDLLPVPQLPASSSSPPLLALAVPALPGAAPAPVALLPEPEKAAPKPEVTPPTKAKQKHTSKKHAKKNVKKSKKTASVPFTGFRTEILPEAIYKKSYNHANSHLPIAYYERDYDALMLFTAAQDDLNGLRAFLDSGRSTEITNAKGETPLLAAVKHGAINTARLLLLHHANPNAADANGATPMSVAKAMDNYPMQRALSEMGAYPLQASN